MADRAYNEFKDVHSNNQIRIDLDGAKMDTLDNDNNFHDISLSHRTEGRDEVTTNT